tara:strand:+ start:203 stop:463 length:261 start_codon:yes stop_codon:yes gene_type:complete
VDRIVAVVEPILTPLILLGLTTMGGWGFWVSMASYDSQQHVQEYENVVNDLRVVVGDLQDVKVDLAAQSVLTDSMLGQILEEVRNN